VTPVLRALIGHERFIHAHRLLVTHRNDTQRNWQQT
jgi:hypothetical protein